MPSVKSKSHVILQRQGHSVDDRRGVRALSLIDDCSDDHGLVIAATLAKETLADTVLGGVTYKESYTLDLVSLTPLR